MIETYFTAKAAEYFIYLAIVAVIIIGGITVWIFVKAYQTMCDRRKKRLERMMDKYFGEDQENE
ncbi:MAG TPA: hypothetical protein H9695_13345 [Candidatus Mediterraneibacter excrementigallinarum]|nr:hypothetical protein [Candidatus Mediterraneibacter excrementigallinarum]